MQNAWKNLLQHRMTAHERLKTARHQAGFKSAAAAAEAFGWPTGTYVGHENGHRGIRREVAERYARAFGVNAFWLLHGIVIEERTLRIPLGLVDLAPDLAAAVNADPENESRLMDLINQLGSVWQHLSRDQRRRLEELLMLLLATFAENQNNDAADRRRS